MDSQIIAAIIGALVLIFVTYSDIQIRRFPTLKSKKLKNSKFFFSKILDWVEQPAREKLHESQFIGIGRTEDALDNLLDSATKNSSIIALCGNKGNFADAYYRRNFSDCRAVKRVFSYDAICDEIKRKGSRNTLDGLKLHLDRSITSNCDVVVFLIKEGKRIADTIGMDFDPPSSFGLALLQDSNDVATSSVLHWEMEMERIKYFFAIEGIAVFKSQAELLKELQNLHNKIIRNRKYVLSSIQDRDALDKAIERLEVVWNTQRGQRKCQ